MRFSIIYKIALPILFVLAASVIFIAVSTKSVLKRAIFKEEFLQTNKKTDEALRAVNLTREHFTTYDSPLSQKKFVQLFQSVATDATARITLWDNEYCVVYSDLNYLIDHCDPENGALERIFTKNEAFFIVRRRDESPVPQTAVENFLNIFIPVKEGGKVVGAIEIRSVAAALLLPIEHAIERIIIIFGLGTISIFAALILTVNIFLLRPIRFIIKVAQLFARGEFFRRVKMNSKDELQTLAESLNFMAINIENLEHERISLLRESKREFISMIAHELRAPIARVRLSLSSILDGTYGNLDPQQGKLLNANVDSLTQLLRLVSDLLTVTQMEEGKFTFKFESVNILKLVEEAIELYSMQANTKNISMEFKKYRQDGVDQSEFEAIIDIERIRLILNNLFSNAIKYTKAGGVVSVAVEPQKDAVLIYVRDSGIGIPKEEQKRVFERFFRAKNAAKESSEGTGLGLYIVKLIIEAHKGKIWFESEDDKGTTFYIRLPRGPRSLAPMIKN